MKIVVIGGSGRVGSNVVRRLVAQGHDAVPAAPSTGVDTITGEGLADVMAGADVVVDVSNAPVWDDDAVREFFTTSTRNVLAAERDAGVGHHLAVTIVGADRLPDSGYLRAKVAQEAEIEAGSIPYTILRATQFFEFLPQIAEAGAEGDSVRLSTGLMQFVAADDVAATRGRAGDRRAGRWPRRARRARGAGHRRLGAAPVRRHRRRADGRLRPARALLRHHARRASLLPGDGARIGETNFDTWLEPARDRVAGGVLTSLLKRGELLFEASHRAAVQQRPQLTRATPSAASSASDGACGRRTTFTGPPDLRDEAAQRVRLPERDRVHAVDAGLEVGIRAPQRFGNELLLGPGAGAGEEGTEEDVHPGVDHERVAVRRRGLANRR